MSRRPSRRYLVPHVLRRLLQKRETIAYPAGPLELPDAYRGQVIVDIDKCVGCKRCSRDCPSQCLLVDREGKEYVRVMISHDLCASCGLCEWVCPTGAIRLLPQFVGAATSRAALRSEWTRGAPHRPDDRDPAASQE